MSCGSKKSYEDANLNHESIRGMTDAVTIELEKLARSIKMYLTKMQTQQEQQNSRMDEGIDAMKAELDTLTEGIHFILGPFWHNVNDEMSELRCTAQKYEVKASEYESRCQNQEETIRNLEEKVEKLEVTIREQNSFLSTLGSTLAGLMWKVSKSSETTKILIESSNLINLFSIISDVLKSFFAVYDRKIPSIRSEEVQFIISLVGIVVNVTALTEGRHFIIEIPQGVEVIQYLVKYVSKFSDSNIQRMMLMAIFNISIHKRGTRLILNERSLFVLLKKQVMRHDGAAMKYVSLKLLQAITYNTDDVTQLSVLFEEIPELTLTEMEQTSTEEERTLIKKIRQQYLKLQNNVIDG